MVFVVRTAAGLYRANKSVLTKNDLRPQLSGPWVTNEFKWRLVMGLVEQEWFYFLQPGPPMTSHDWERPIEMRRIGRFLKVETVEDYLLATAQLHVDEKPWAWQQQRAPAITSAGGTVVFPHSMEVPSVTNIYNTTINSAAMVNVGAETVNVIQSQSQAIASSDPAPAEGPARLTETLDAPEFSEEEREELEAYVTELTAEVSQPPERRQWHRIKGFGRAITSLANIAPKFLEAWNNA